ncbi:MAG: DUF1501 domain-containing protein [bacterium]
MTLDNIKSFDFCPPSRRRFLWQSSLGFGSLALTSLLAEKSRAESSGGSLGSAQPIFSDLSPRKPHYPAKVKSVVFLFMEGGVSQVDSFDPKPMLEKYHGQDPRKAIGKLEKTQFANVGTVLKSPWQFARRGQSGIEVSDLFPHIANIIDETVVIRSMTSNFPEHTSANYFIHSGTGLQGRPSAGAWAGYGLGTENQNLPGFMVLNGGRIPSGGLDLYSNGFLPATFQGSLLNANGMPMANLQAAASEIKVQGRKRDFIRKLNQFGLAESGPADALESAIRNAETAARMQTAVPELIDISGESEATKKLYGLDSDYEPTRTYARQCLIARRMVERGVRFIELTIPGINGVDRWDAHGGLVSNHGKNARAMDQPSAALVTDLKERGLLDSTLVVWSGEFGRTPFAQGSDGRDHNEHGFSLWMAGGGLKKGITYGATDDWGYKVADKRLEIHDLHATILHLLGLDHTRLTFRFGGRDLRLTDVRGEVIRDILA